MFDVYCITPTGNRPEGMALLSEYVNAQTYAGPLTWIVVDDCDPATRIVRPRDRSINFEVIRPDWRWQPGMNTQAQCMAAALAHVPDDAAVLVLEDDDAYLPEYLTTMLEALRTVELVGEREARYYNVASGRWKIMQNKRHSSLCATACRGGALATFRQLCANGAHRFIDIRLWEAPGGSSTLLATHNVIGIKGLPGRPGIGVGHRSSFGNKDVDDTLRSWIGDYASNYRIFRRAA